MMFILYNNKLKTYRNYLTTGYSQICNHRLCDERVIK